MTKNSTNKRESFLVLRCQTGDREAFDELLRSMQDRLWRYISNLARDADLADDITQEVFLIIYRKIGWLDDPALFWPWVYRIATRTTFKALKKRSKGREEAFDEGHVVAAPVVEENVQLDARLLEGISPASRAVLVLHYVEDLSISETAEVLDISVGTTKSRLAYGLKLLRRKLDEMGELSSG